MIRCATDCFACAYASASMLLFHFLSLSLSWDFPNVGMLVGSKLKRLMYDTQDRSDKASEGAGK